MGRPAPKDKSELRRSDAVHRALLTGLLSNVGQRGETHEYAGQRGSRFHIFPGSALFKQQPRWVMAAELVETTRLYARTVAPVQPEWIERAAEHLVKRTWSDPHWNAATSHVVAYERVTLHGLIIIPQRPVHYGAIDPKRSREIFIQAIVEGEYLSDGPFYRHNQKLIDEIQTLEAKSRSRDLLAGSQVRYDFYDARIPGGIHNGPAFEKWRRQIERHNPRVLFMTRRDLMLQSAGSVTQELFPDALVVGGVAIPLEYHLEPGHPADGVTAIVPLTALTQLPAQRFEWLVPGLLKEKITGLIKSLPKELRVNFVPAPDFAEMAMGTLRPGHGSLIEALALFLGKQKGMFVPREAFDPSSLLDHLLMNFRVVDERGKTLAEGRDLDAIRTRLGLEVKSRFEQLTHPKYTRDDVTNWDFGDLPESITVQRHGLTLTAYPALVDCSHEKNAGSGVALRLLESADAARTAHVAGMRRLLTIELRDELKYLAANIPGFRQMAMQYATLGSPEQLKADIVGETINRAFLFDADVRTAMEYELRKSAGRRHQLLETAAQVAELARTILEAYHQLALQLERPAIPVFAPAIADVRDQLTHLMPPDFLTTTPDAWLVQYPRFLKAAALRLEKLATRGHTRDAEQMEAVSPFWQQYKQRTAKNREQRIVDGELETFRWMIEELRVSLFAQELKTSIPVSPKRLEKQWERVRR